MRIKEVHRGLWVALQYYSSSGYKDPKSCICVCVCVCVYIYLYLSDRVLWS